MTNTIAAAQKRFALSESEGQRRMLQLHQGSREQLEISPNLWSGVGLVRGGAGTSLVGDSDTVALRMLEYADLGIDTFVLSGYPHLEEAYRVAELVFPRLPLKNPPTLAVPQHVLNPLSELVAKSDLLQPQQKCFLEVSDEKK